MTTSLRTYFSGALAFAFVVTWAALGLLDAFLATAACLTVVNARPLEARLRGLRGLRTPKPARRRRPRVEYELVPDEPSLVL
jgi:hypothetical protein